MYPDFSLERKPSPTRSSRALVSPRHSHCSLTWAQRGRQADRVQRSQGLAGGRFLRCYLRVLEERAKTTRHTLVRTVEFPGPDSEQPAVHARSSPVWRPPNQSRSLWGGEAVGLSGLGASLCVIACQASASASLENGRCQAAPRGVLRPGLCTQPLSAALEPACCKSLPLGL